MNQAILEGKKINKNFGNLKALNRVDFCINKGEILGLIGPNGSGKSTLVNVITNVYPAEKGGLILFKGERINGFSPFKTARLGIARTYQVIKPFVNMTVGENVAIGAIFGKEVGYHSMREVNREVDKQLDFVGMGGMKDIPADSLNIVYRKQMDLAKALASRPDLLLIDEVMAGLNTKDIEKTMGLIKEINRLGMTILCIEHVMKAIMGVSNRIMVLHHGEKIGEDSPDEIMKNEKVIEAYLGSRYRKK